MDLSNFVSVSNVIELILDHWIISLLALLVFTVLLVFLFKGFRRGFRLAIFFAVLVGLVASGVVVAYFALNQPLELISFGIAWMPTIIFSAGILVSTLIGVWRGFRKSAILLAHAVCVGGLCIGLYFFCISSAQVDEWLLETVNFFMGGSTALQDTLGVHGGSTLREVFAEYIPSLFGYGSEVGILLEDSSAYVMTLVDVAYRIAFAIVFYYIYLMLIFLLYIIYHIFYSERKYKRKKNRAFYHNRTDATYKKRRVGGGIIGFFRGLTVGLISLSFVGSAFYITAGGTGEGELAEFKFGDPNADFAYSVYRSVESYGTQGIFKILNTVKDPEDTPYYLFAADLVLSGGLDDEKNGISENIKLREELGAYVGFARDTMNLLMRYGEEDLTPVLNGESSEDAMGVVVDIMSNPAFALEFENLVDNFDSKTYVVNLSLSLVNTIVAKIDDMSFMSDVSEDNKELLKVMFQDGYLTDVIPDEREMKYEAVNGLKESRPCFKLNHLLTKQDTQIILKVVLSYLSNGDTLELTKKILPDVEGLSIFGTERKEEMDPVLARLYCYLENKYLTAEGADGVTCKQITKKNIAWGEEIRSLIGVAENLLALYENVEIEDGADYLQILRTVFDEENERYGQNIALYDEVCAAIPDSVLLGQVLSSSLFMNAVTESFSALGENVYIPEKIVFENRYDEKGNLLSHGETYQLFYGLRMLAEKENADLMDFLLDSSVEKELSDILDMLAEAFVPEDKSGNTLADYFTESVLFRSAISAVFIEQSADKLIVPNSTRESDYFGLPVNLIEKGELKWLFANLSYINEVLLPLTEDAATEEMITQFVKSKDLFRESNIIAATVVNYIVESGEFRDILKIPTAYLRAGSRGELKNYGADNIWNSELEALASALDEIFGVTAEKEFEFTQDAVTEYMFEFLQTLNKASTANPEKTKLEVSYESVIIRNDLAVELDTALDGNLDEQVLKAAKRGQYYRASEIAALSDALAQLELNSFEELENYDASEINCFNLPSETHPESTRLDVMYESLIVSGMITRGVRDAIRENGVLVDHKNAHEETLGIYKKAEVEALITLLGDSAVEEYALSTVKELRRFLEPDSANEPRSYLVAATVSNNLLGNEELSIPASIVTERLISARELVLLIDAYTALNGEEGNLDGWKVGTNMVLPTRENRDAIVAGTIMRATMTQFIIERNGSFTAAQEHVAAESDWQGETVAVLCEEQFLAFFAVLDLWGTNEFDIPGFNSLQDIERYRDNLSVFYAFDTTRYDISAVVANFADTGEAYTEAAYGMSSENKLTLTERTQEVFPLEAVEEIISARG